MKRKHARFYTIAGMSPRRYGEEFKKRHSRGQAAHGLGVTVATVEAWEAGRRKPQGAFTAIFALAAPHVPLIAITALDAESLQPSEFFHRVLSGKTPSRKRGYAVFCTSSLFPRVASRGFPHGDA